MSYEYNGKIEVPKGRTVSDREAARSSERDAVISENAKRVERDGAKWTTFEGVIGLRCKDSRFFGVPNGSAKSARTFDIIDIVDRSLVAQVSRGEVFSWLLKAEG